MKARDGAKCVCNRRKKQKCEYHAMYPDGRPYERLLSTSFLNLMSRLDRESKQKIDTQSPRDARR